MNPILVFGRSGQVATELAELAKTNGLPVRCVGRTEFDLETQSDVDGFIAASGARAVINAAAYTAVDKAESERDRAFRLNGDVPGILAGACALRRLPFVHLSTDYVFDGTKDGPYVEDDPVAPQNVYGESKLAGERAVAEAQGLYAVLRTAWVFSAHAKNFLKTMNSLAERQDEVRVVADQFGQPSWARDVARAALAAADAMVVQNRPLGILHVAGGEEMSWADFAERIFRARQRRGRLPVRVVRIPTAEYPTPARRPANSRLSTQRARAVLSWEATSLDAAVADCLAQNEGSI